MKTLGIICEYNPFHNGHKYHIEMAKRIYGSDNVICIMSGSFVQRGEPAIIDKWSRAKLAIQEGADLIIELPVVYSCQTAEIFAFGAVSILNSLNIVDYLCFGSEALDIKPLINIAAIMKDEPAQFKYQLKSALNTGISYPKAVACALKEYLNEQDYETAADILNYPNNVLGIEYIKALMILESKITPVTIRRYMSDYNDVNIRSSIASATAIRLEIKNKGLSDKVKISVPSSCYETLREQLESEKGPVLFENLSDIILYKFREMNCENLRKYMNVKEGLEYKIKKAAYNSYDLNSLIQNIKSKRYTRANIQRLICHILLNLDKELINCLKLLKCPGYVRVLAFNEKGAALIKQIKKYSNLPIIVKPADFKTDDPILKKVFELDLKATDLFNLAKPNKLYRKSGEDYITSPILVRS